MKTKMVRELKPGDVIRIINTGSFNDTVVVKNDIEEQYVRLARPYIDVCLTFSTSPGWSVGVEDYKIPYSENDERTVEFIENDRLSLGDKLLRIRSLILLKLIKIEL